MNKLSKSLLGFIIVLVAFTLAAIAFYFYKNETDEIRKEKYQYLEAISNLKIDQITKWNSERLSDAKLFPTLGKFIKSTVTLISDRNDKDSKDFLFQTLEPIKERNGYKDLFIIDKNNRVLFSLNPGNNQVDSFTIVTSKKAIQLDSILFLDFYYCNTHSEIHMDIISPIKDNFGNALGTFILRYDPNQFLFPLIQNWPIPSKTAESLIFRNEGTQLRLLSPGKFNKNSAMNFTMPLNKEEYVGVKSVKDNAGIVEGLDYRGAKVIASLKKVPGTSWYLVSKVDQDEIFSEMLYRAGTITMISVITVLFIGAFTLYLYKHKQSATYKNLFLKEKELSETKEEYRTALYSIGDAVIATDRYSIVKQMNSVAEELTGWKESEAIGKKLDEVFRIINEETKQQVQNPVKQVLKEGTVIGLANHTLLISKDGKEIPIADSGSPIKNDENQIIGVILVFRDQTEERAKQKELFESNKKFSKIFQHSSDSISLTELSTGKLFEVNEGFEKMFGYKRSEVIGKSTVDLQLWSNPNDRIEMIDQLKNNGHIKNFESVGIHKNSKKVVALISGEILVLNDEQYLLLTIKDITERKIFEESLKASEEKIKTFFNGIHLPVFVHPFKSEGFANFIEVNDSACDLYKYSREELLKLSPQNISSQEDVQQKGSKEARRQQLENGRLVFEATHITKYGKRFPVEINSTIFNWAEQKVIISIITDITERKQFDKELKNSEERFRKAFITSPDSININRLSDGVYVSINKGFTKITGYTESEVIGKTSAQIQIWADIKYRNELVEKLKTTSVVDNFEAKFRMKDGIIKDGLMSAAVIELNGELHIISITRDISDRKRAEEEVLKTKIHFQKLIENAPDGIVQISVDGEFKYVSPSAKRIFGYPTNERVNERLDELTHPEDLPKVLGLISNLVNNPLINPTIEYRFKDYSGNYLWIESTFTNLLNEPSVQAIVINFRDINFRKTVETKLRTLSQAVEQSPVIIVITDLKGSIDYVNPKFTEVTGYTFEEARGKNPRILKSGHTTQQEYKELWKLISEKNEWRGEFFNRKKNGELYWESAYITPILNEFGEITNYIALKEDITERKNLLADLIESKEKAEEMNRVKAYFFANMSHELRTPFVGIVGFSELLSESLQNPEEKEMANQILKSSKRLTETLNKILNVTRLEFDKLEVKLRDIDVIEMIDQLKILFSKSASAKNISIKTKISQDEIVVKTDGRMLDEMITNLLNNAIKYTQDGFIDISAETIVRENKNYLLLKVADTGVGIPKNKQEIIWKEFRQVSEGMNRSFEGTGLGLTIIKKYVETLSGKITLESEIGKGSTFIIEIPVEIVSKKEVNKSKEIVLKQTQNNIEIKSRKPKILYVEDDVIALSYVDKVLKAFYEIDTAFNATIALELANKNIYEAMLLDINLGKGIDGVELMQMMRKINGYNKIPIVAVTAYAAESDRLEFLAKGFTHYLSKPFTSVELRGMLGKIFNS